MAELADAPDLGSGVNRRAGSSPVIRIDRVFRVFRILWKPCFFVFDISVDINAGSK